MARVEVRPEEFTFVDYDPAQIRAITEEVADLAGIGDDVTIVIDIDQASPFGNVKTVIEGRTVTIRAESAAFEDAKNLRQLSVDGSRQMLARQLFRVADRLSGDFGDPPPDPDLDFAHQTAWDAYALGRFERLGFEAGKHRRRYHFRLRHGFTDVADRVFDRLWTSDDLTWADLEAACAETEAARSPAGEPTG